MDGKEQNWNDILALAPALFKLQIIPEDTMDALWKADRCGCRMCQRFITQTMDEVLGPNA